MEDSAQIGKSRRGLKFIQVARLLSTTHYDKGIKVCEATETEWMQYVLSLCCGTFQFGTMIFQNGAIYIVEVRETLRGHLAHAIRSNLFSRIGKNDKRLVYDKPFKLEGCGLVVSNCNFGPATNIGAKLVSLEGGNLLNSKAIHWSMFSDVQYILCLCVWVVRKVRQYKLFSVKNGEIEGHAPVDTPPLQILNPALIFLDSRRLLALRDDVPISDGFAQPNVAIDLNKVLEQAMEYEYSDKHQYQYNHGEPYFKKIKTSKPRFD
ncbi:hypothetical protein THRCLA_21665 [Thraustotheca clavata]|uniref:Uncharacterized protein n=1 Tax=Thraustotheca clavata TaxID=74557 RepID=A0A1V9ZRS4_9STRA|nr:hypothetical protein THRCLA_21665 [Thraustotheca clavata]